MTSSINQSATEITFNHPSLDNTAIQLELTVTYNCGTPVVYNLQDKVAAITDGTFILDLDDYYTTTDPSKFADGIYTFALKFVYMTTSSNIRTIINTQCFLVDYDLKCSYINAKDFINFDYITFPQLNFSCCFLQNSNAPGNSKGMWMSLMQSTLLGSPLR